jgi:uncharacterized RDD family membrane protein YckC
MQTIKITTSQNIDIDYEVAGLGERIVGAIIDYGIFIVIYFAGLIVVTSSGFLSSSGIGYLWILIIYGALFVFYDLMCEIFMNGQSVGKKIMKIKVISLNGARPTIGQYLMRWLFRIIDFTLTAGVCALVCAAVSDNCQRLGDMVAGTILIKTRPRTQINQIAFMPEADGYIPTFAEAAQLSDHDIELVHEVINNYIKTHNSYIVYNMAVRVKEHLGITALPEGMNDMKFLQTVVKDHTYINAQTDAL